MATHSFKNRGETRAWAISFIKQIQRPSVVLLSGDLGAGKTQVVRWMLESLGAPDANSPTFAIHQQYFTPQGDVDHVDLYRVKSDEDLEASGFWDLFQQDSGLVFVEWADRLPEDVWPSHWQHVHIHLQKEAEEGRTVRAEIKLPSPKPR